MGFEPIGQVATDFYLILFYFVLFFLYIYFVRNTYEILPIYLRTENSLTLGQPYIVSQICSFRNFMLNQQLYRNDTFIVTDAFSVSGTNFTGTLLWFTLLKYESMYVCL